MKILLMVLFMVCSSLSWGQFKHTAEVSAELKGASEERARKILLLQAAYKGIEKYSSELGYKFEDFDKNLKSKFALNFEAYQQRKLSEKFGASYKESLTEADKNTFLATLESEREESLINFSRIINAVRSHSFLSL